MKKQYFPWYLVAITLLWVSSSMALELSSPAFRQGDKIPSQYTCDGQNISPPLIFKDIPAKTKSLVLIMDDPDAPAGTWTHWVVYNLPANSGGLTENLPTLPEGAFFARNSWNNLGYGGPCPPDREHRYFFKLYAIDKTLSLIPGSGIDSVEGALKGHILASSELIGRYQRTK